MSQTPSSFSGPRRDGPGGYRGGPRRDGPGDRDRDRDRGGSGGSRFGRRPRRKMCTFCADKIKLIDYKDTPRLRRFLSDRARIEPRRKTGTCAKHQRMLTTALKRARHMALLPYTAEHVRDMMSPAQRAAVGGPPPERPALRFEPRGEGPRPEGPPRFEGGPRPDAAPRPVEARPVEARPVEARPVEARSVEAPRPEPARPEAPREPRREVPAPER